MNKRGFIGTRARKFPRPSNVQQPPINKKDVDYTIEQALTVFVRAKEVEGVRPRTVKQYLHHIRYLTDYLTQIRGFVDVYVNDLDADLIRDYVRYMLKEKRRYEGTEGRKDKTIGLSVNTVNMRLRTLRTMCRFWHKEGIAETNAMENIKPVKSDEEEELIGLSDATIDIILDSFNENQFADWRDKILCFLLLDTGLRIKEATSLTIDRIDFRTMTLYVPSRIAKNRRNREVPISYEVAKLLQEMYNESLQYFGETEYVFNNAYGDPFTAGAFRKRLNRLKTRLGIEKLSPHMFRHTFCRKYILNGGDIFTLQRIVDHADIQTTRRYIQMDTQQIRSQHNKHSPLRRIFKRKRL